MWVGELGWFQKTDDKDDFVVTANEEEDKSVDFVLDCKKNRTF